ncbi:hypothetical protein AaE_014973 [Aphanomyces astaci]|uniref:PDZ domain-containing protein n=1 Tax=Aphanomyces astaci TaxID=112090 RepID=A0A6A4Z4C7_APHAT|nr:hypothetical protein AaE_014973 [Aphanomyces astaci]
MVKLPSLFPRDCMTPRKRIYARRYMFRSTQNETWGFNFYQDGTVTHVVDQSPAYRAGLTVGSIICDVWNNNANVWGPPDPRLVLGQLLLVMKVDQTKRGKRWTAYLVARNRRYKEGAILGYTVASCTVIEAKCVLQA